MRRILVVVAVAVNALAVAVAPGVAGSSGNRTGQYCQKDQWQSIVDANGVQFTSVGSCTSYVARNGPTAITRCTSIGTAHDDTVATVADGEVYCGIGGDDHVTIVAAGGTFIGGPGDDSATTVNGTLNGNDGKNTACAAGTGAILISVTVIGCGGGDDIRLALESNNSDYQWDLVVYNDGNDTATVSVTGTITGGDEAFAQTFPSQCVWAGAVPNRVLVEFPPTDPLPPCSLILAAGTHATLLGFTTTGSMTATATSDHADPDLSNNTVATAPS